ncbi:hypothetical protein FGO68_gene8007 [Halteria grandinella]|uniref:Uncharacterized protein n=1 Tax=Halteria grandinella TaxID=5974 RepID=A0A8J8NHW2_HALGN|nr:hypothetical protein FGO68_gene8007 [Halteria grandinella]
MEQKNASTSSLTLIDLQAYVAQFSASLPSLAYLEIQMSQEQYQNSLNTRLIEFIQATTGFAKSKGLQREVDLYLNDKDQQIEDLKNQLEKQQECCREIKSMLYKTQEMLEITKDKNKELRRLLTLAEAKTNRATDELEKVLKGKLYTSDQYDIVYGSPPVSAYSISSDEQQQSQEQNE